MEQQVVDVQALNGGFGGTAVDPTAETWDQDRAAWNLAADQHPEMVAYVESADDIAAVINHARSNGLGIAAQGTGHGAGSRGPLAGSILIRTDRMKGIEIDPEAGTGRYEAGVLWMEANPVAGEHGLANLSGSAPDVGIVGCSRILIDADGHWVADAPALSDDLEIRWKSLLGNPFAHPAVA